MKLLSRTGDKIFSVKFGTRRDTSITLSTALDGEIIRNGCPLTNNNEMWGFLNFFEMFSI